ncbi:MAG: tetratricopeptide repeat protein [Desulfobacterales bacterium]|nr:tetratricopeptide repeat protein [Desulfobacterales bacterium]
MNKPRNIQQNLPLIISLLLIAAILITYWQVKDFDFICFDDRPYVTENHHVRAGLTIKGFTWAFTSFHVSNWHPLTWLSHMLDRELYGLNPMGHHWTSLQIHIANTLLLFFILQYMTGALWRSAFVTALFALHPLHVESVAWVAERKDVLSTFFGMLALLSYCRYAKQPSLAKYLLTILFLSMGLMAKPMLVTLPFLLLLLDFWPLARLRSETLSRLVLEKIPLFVPVVISSCLTFMAQQSSGAVKPLESFSLTVRIANAFVSYASYAVKAIWPHNLTVFYPHPGNSLPLWQVFGAILLVGGASFLAIRSLKKYPYIAVGLFWYLGMLVPVIGLVQVGPQAMADRYTYIPMTGLFIVITWGFSDLSTKWHYRKIVLALFAVIILSALTVSTFFQLGYWRNSVALFERAVSITENNCLAHNNLGAALLEKGKPDEAVLHLKEALRIEPGCRAALYNLGAALSAQGKLDEAVLHYNDVLKINPKDAIVHNNLADVLSVQGKLNEAVLHYNEALKIDPDYASAHCGFGSLLIKQGKFKEAMFHLAEAIRIDPDYAEAYYNIGVIFSGLKKFKGASEFFSKAFQIDPDYKEARDNLLILKQLMQHDEK